jgi:hypothetical protein
MMSLFPIGRPRLGISFHANSVGLVEMTPRWPRRRAVRRAVTEPVPKGLLQPNPDRPNVTDVAEFVNVVRRILKVTGRRTTAVSLPLACAHVGIFGFEQLSPRGDDRLAVLGWRFQHDEHIDVRDARVVYRVFPGHKGNGPTQPAGSMAHVLAVAVKRQIFEQYEQILERAGVIPTSIGWSTLQLLDMARPLVKPAGELILVHDDGEALTVIAVREGIPVFLRRKLSRSPIRDTRRELIRSLQYYDDLYPHQRPDQPMEASLLYQFQEPQQQSRMGRDAGHEMSEAEMLVPVDGSHWQIQRMPSTWMHAGGANGALNGMAQWSALASIYYA